MTGVNGECNAFNYRFFFFFFSSLTYASMLRHTIVELALTDRLQVQEGEGDRKENKREKNTHFML
jgi:hypothetical protein